MFRIIPQITNLTVFSELLFFVIFAESLSIITDVNPTCFPIITTWRHTSASVGNREATSLWIFVLKPSTFPDAFLATTPETDLAQEA
ncbi:hypothetical protein ERO13_A13G139820v2 [Gossypium hirsutum]|uniref:Secreted protein n=2 Tax=Gossypium TaxID=3633 RepID=A0A5D2MNG8_GOSTO|nr:hypothetical protein ERO13_A13G139820v2 [Gossypium hirsutum]TYG86852.1 hypothetical protein ES288_A13G165800v1 [Gossypium darwinii]TYH92239.1 hypothetical protein ES332_A13G168300v1 [Gossypium tomentosum]